MRYNNSIMIEKIDAEYPGVWIDQYEEENTKLREENQRRLEATRVQRHNDLVASYKEFIRNEAAISMGRNSATEAVYEIELLRDLFYVALEKFANYELSQEEIRSAITRAVMEMQAVACASYDY